MQVLSISLWDIYDIVLWYVLLKFQNKPKLVCGGQNSEKNK